MNTHGVHDDLRYVREVVDRAALAGNPAGMYFLWAVISFFGFSIIDVWPDRTGLYWMIAGPAGGVASAWLGRRAARARGQESHREGRIHALHWTGLWFSILLLVPLHFSQLIPIEAFPRLVLLLVAFAYFTFGVTMDRKMLWVGAIVAASYLSSIVLRDFRWVWTLTAAVLAVALAVAGLVAASGARRSAREARP